METDAQHHHLNKRKSFFTAQRPSTGTGCPERLWSSPHWRYSGTVWTQSCAMCSGMVQVTHWAPFHPLPFCEISVPQHYNINTSLWPSALWGLERALSWAPLICSSYRRVLHDKDQNITILCCCALHLPLLLWFSYHKQWACGVCAELKEQKSEFSFHSNMHILFITISCTNLTWNYFLNSGKRFCTDSYFYLG